MVLGFELDDVCEADDGCACSHCYCSRAPGRSGNDEQMPKGAFMCRRITFGQLENNVMRLDQMGGRTGFEGARRYTNINHYDLAAVLRRGRQDVAHLQRTKGCCDISLKHWAQNFTRRAAEAGWHINRDDRDVLRVEHFGDQFDAFSAIDGRGHHADIGPDCQGLD